MTESKFLRYGDYTYLVSSETPRNYLSARSILEEKVFFIQAPPIEEIDSKFYDNQAELVFAIFPKLNYQAIKNFAKIKANEDPSKTELLKKRLRVEEDQNEKIIQKMLGTVITFGSEIQLYHVSSKCFIRATREKNPYTNDLYNLKLSKRGGSGMYFKINPYLAFKRDGERVSHKDIFFLENTKLQAAIVYKGIPEFPPSDILIKEEDQLEFNRVRSSVKTRQETKPGNSVPCLPILELNSTFLKYEAGLRQSLDCPLIAKQIYMRNFNTTSTVASSKIICWGDYVRIKFMIDNKTTGYFYSDPTIIGNSPYVYCKAIRAPLPHEKDSFQAIFQLIPESEEMYGLPIQFKGEKIVSIRLKHLLTGRYLVIKNAEEKCCLSDTLDEFLTQISENLKKEELKKAERELKKTQINRSSNPIFQNNNKNEPARQFDGFSIPGVNSLNDLILGRFMPKQNNERNLRNSDPLIDSGSLNAATHQNLEIGEIEKDKEKPSLLNILDQVQNQVNEEKSTQEQEPIKKFLEKISIQLNNASQDDDEFLTTSSVFSLQSDNKISLSVGSFQKGKGENNSFQWMKKPNPTHSEFKEFFYASFHEKAPLEKEEFEAIYSKQSSKYFHFTSVAPEEISEILAVHSRLYPLVKILQETVQRSGEKNIKMVEKGGKRNSVKPAKNEEGAAERKQIMINQALDAVKKINIWLDGLDESLDTGSLSKKVKQKLLRELGVIDILFFILIKFFKAKLLKIDTQDLDSYKPLAQAIFGLLSDIISQNKVNNIYAFQWSQLQQQMTFSQTIANDLGVDKLLSQIFYENVIEIGELQAIPQHLDFKNYDLKALNIAIALYKYNPIRSSKDRDQIIDTLVMREENRNRIFRKFMKEQLGNPCLIVENAENGVNLRIDASLELRDKKKFDYSLGIIKLATEISKNKPQIVYKHLKDYFPQDLCTSTFDNREWSHLYRSAFLELFMEMYFAEATAMLPEITFPNHIKFLANVKVPDSVTSLYHNRKESVRRRFTDDGFDIKQFINAFLNDPHKWIEDEHKYVKSVFRLIHAMCKRGLYELDDLRKLKQALYNYLTIGLAVIHDEILNEGEKVVANKGFVRKASKSKTIINPKAKKSQTKGIKDQKKPDKNAKKKVTEVHARQEEGHYHDNERNGANYEQLPDDETERGETYWRKTEIDEMILWMQEILQTLIFIENYELDNKLKEFFENEKSLRFFNEKLLSRTGSNEGFNSVFLNKIKRDKLDFVLKYMNDNFSSQNYEHILLLLEMLLINDLTLTRPLVQLLYLNFSSYKQFLSGINQAQIIYSYNIELYENYTNIYNSLKSYEVELDSLHEKQINQKSPDIYVAIDLTLAELLKNLYEESDQLERDPSIADKLVHIYGDYNFEILFGKEKQSLLLKLGFFDIITNLFVPLTDKSCFKDESKREKFIVNFLYFYIYFCFKNPDNQQIMTKSRQFLEGVFSIEFPNLQPLLLRLISEIYRDNYSLLINISQNRPNVIHLFLEKFFTGFSASSSSSNVFFIYCLRIFPTFFQIRNNFLSHNQTFFADTFHSMIIQQKELYDINYILSVRLDKFLGENSLENFILPMNKDVIEIPLQVSFAIYFLNTFAMMTAGPNFSNSNACLKNKSYLSIKEIAKLIKRAGHWFNLKLALVTFLNHVYIKNKKLEDNEVAELKTIVKECLLDELQEYLRFLKNRNLYSGWSPKQRFARSFPDHYVVQTDFKYCENIGEAYHQYILYGVMDSFLYYGDRVKDEASEADHSILDDYCSFALRDISEYWKKPSDDHEGGALESANYLKNKMIAPLDEPTDPEINEADIFNTQKNERKKVSSLKREMMMKTAMSRNTTERAAKMKIYNFDKSEIHKTKSTNDYMSIDLQTIEKKHNNELEVLIKFLLESKEEDQWKFKLTIKSFMNVLTSEDTSAEIKQLTLKILRKLANFKEDPDLYEAIQLDFINLNFIDFFDDIIINAKTEDDRLEFIMGMIDFLDDASPKIQQELYNNLVKDEDNVLLETIAKFILTSFEEFRENEKNYNEQTEDIQNNAKTVVYKKMFAVIYALEFLRLSCENHFEAMQNYLREQIQGNVKSKRSINFINLIADIFSRYTKSVNERNAKLGIQIIDTLIEMLQGPCQENQIALCNTKMLENLEDLTVEVKNIRKRREGLIWIEMNKKIIILIQAILEGSYNSYIVQQVSIHVDVKFFLERMNEAFVKASKEKNRIVYKKKPIEESKVTNLMTIDFLEGQLKEQEKYDPNEVGYDALLHEGIELAIILNFLSDTSPEIQQQVGELKKASNSSKAENFYKRYIGQIEIVNKKGDLQRIYFPIVKKTKYLSGVTKIKFLDEVKRESANEKLFGLLRYQKLFIDEMDHFLSLRQRGLKFSLTHFSRLRNANLILAFATNLIILFSFDQDLTNNLQGESSINDVVKGLGIAHIILSALIVVFWGIFQAPLDLKAAGRRLKFQNQNDFLNVEKDDEREMSGFLEKFNYWYSRAYYMVFHTYMIYLILALLFSFLGTFYSIIFFAFLLLDLIDRSVILNNVVKSVTLNYKQLLMTFFLGILIIYMYAVVGAFSVIDSQSPNDYNPNDPNSSNESARQKYCSSVWHCFLTIANQGLRSGGGIGEVLDQDYEIGYGGEGFAKRYFFSLLHFLMIVVILLNIIFGIIIDTFAELRDQKRLKDYDETNRCFICNLERTLFEKEGKSFERHVRVEHSVWNYLYYMVYLQDKDKFEYNGTESYIYEKIQSDDLSWFPIQRAMSLSHKILSDEEEDVKTVLEERFANFEKKVYGILSSMSANLGNQSLKTLKSSL